jgi:hypothetical protein
MAFNSHLASVLFGVLAYVGGSDFSVRESTILGPVVRILPQEIAGYIGASLSQGRWTVLVGFLSIVAAFRFQVKLTFYLELFFSAVAGRCLATFMREPPHNLIEIAGEFVTEFLLVAVILFPISVLIFIGSHVLSKREIRK